MGAGALELGKTEVKAGVGGTGRETPEDWGPGNSGRASESGLEGELTVNGFAAGPGHGGAAGMAS